MIKLNKVNTICQKVCNIRTFLLYTKHLSLIQKHLYRFLYFLSKFLQENYFFLNIMYDFHIFVFMINYAFSSFGSNTFSIIATIAAGTIPEPPKMSCTASGAEAKMAPFAPIP